MVRDPITRILEALPSARQHGAGWQARCPAHDDHRASLSITTGDDGRVLLKCHVSCTAPAIVAALGLTMRDLFPDRDQHEAEATFDYVDEQRSLLFQVVRFPGKKFRQRRPDGAGGWIWNLNGVRRVLYRLPDLKGHDTVFIVEGEKDAETLWALGLPAATNAGGAGKWHDAYSQQLVSAGVTRVPISPDCDTPGWAHADRIARSCLAAGLEPCVVRLPLSEKGADVSDYLATHTTEDLLELLKHTPPYVPPATASTSDPAGIVTPSGPAIVASPITTVEWPDPLKAPAYYGVFGAIVKALDPHTEADPAAILIQQLVIFGSIIGRTAHFRAEADTHYLNLFAVVVGMSAKGRKGVSTGRARGIYGPIDPTWAANCQKSGLSSGEGLIWAVRDPIEKQNQIKQQGGRVVEYQTVVEDPGVTDKRLLVVESEFASTLKVLAREGNTLSALMRQAWDGQDLRVLTKNSPAKASGPHIGIIGNITSEELRRYLDATEAANGFGNRFLWVLAQRSKLLPDGGGTPDLGHLVARVKQAVELAHEVDEMRRDSEGGALWHEIYGRLSAGRPGLLGAMTARAEAQVMRLACLYALSGLSPLVRRPHLEAALEVWRYCFESASYIFGQSLGDPTADEILRALRAAGADGLTRSDISKLFGRNRSSNDIGRALALLEGSHLARRGCIDDTGGRPAECWFHEPTGYERNEKSPSAGGDISFNSFLSYPDKPIPPMSAPAAVLETEVEEL